MKPLYAAVVIPHLASQASLRLRPQLANQPLVILEGVRPHERVYSANAKAFAQGLRLGMTRVEVESFALVRTLPRSLSEEQAAAKILLEATSIFTPRAEFCPTHTPHWECLLDLTGTECLLGSPTELGHKILAHLSTLGFTSTLALCSNPDAALSIARSAKQLVSTIPDHLLRQSLSPLSLEVLNLTADEQDRFHIWGIHTLGELAALPERDLITRLGQTGKQLLQRARGELPHLLQPVVPAFDLSESLDFEDPIETLEPLLFCLNPMIDQLILRAQSRALAIASITFTAALHQPSDRFLDDTPSNAPAQLLTRTIRPAVPTIHRPLLLKMLQLDLESHPPAGALTRICLEAESGEVSPIQLAFFAPPMPEPTRFEDTYARLIALVGEANIGRITPTDTHAADPFRLERFKLPRALEQAPTPRPPGSVPATVIRRLRPPAPIHVLLSQQDKRVVQAFFFESRRFDVLRCYGPWRSSGEWWHLRQWSFDTWDLAARAQDDGELLLCVIAYDLIRKHWQFEGIYD